MNNPPQGDFQLPRAMTVSGLCHVKTSPLDHGPRETQTFSLYQPARSGINCQLPLDLAGGGGGRSQELDIKRLSML